MDTENGGVNWITIVAERRIEEAIEQGLFDNLPGKGKPLVFDDDPLSPPHLRVVPKVLHNARVVPTWISLEHEIEEAKVKAEIFRDQWLAGTSRDGGDLTSARAEYLRLLKRANDLILHFNVIGPFSQRGPIPFRIKDRMAQWDSELGIVGSGISP
jgi:DnaJ family protein C protein 28